MVTVQHSCLSGQGAIAAGSTPEIPVTKQKYRALPELGVCEDEVTLSRLASCYVAS